MAISLVDELLVLSTGSNLGSYTATSDFTVAGGANNILIVSISMSKNSAIGNDEVEVTAEGITMTPVLQLASGGGAGGTYGGLYYIVNPSAGATTIVANPTTDIGRGMIIWCGEYSGIDNSDPFGATVSSETPDTTPPGITPEAASNVVVSMMAGRGGAAPYTADSNVNLYLSNETGTSATGDCALFVGDYNTVGTSQVDVFGTADPAGLTIALAVELRASSTTVAGTGSPSITPVTSSGTSLRTITGSGSSTVGSVETSGTSERNITGSGSSSTALVTASGIVAVGSTWDGVGNPNTPITTASGTAEREVVSSGAATISPVESSGTIYTNIIRRGRSRMRIGMGLMVATS